MDLVSFEDSLGLKLLGFSQNTHYFYLDNGELRSVNETKSKSKKANWNSLTPDGVMYSAPNLNAAKLFLKSKMIVITVIYSSVIRNWELSINKYSSSNFNPFTSSHVTIPGNIQGYSSYVLALRDGITKSIKYLLTKQHEV